jgi:putative transposase
LSYDNDPLLRYGQWLANLDILEIESVRSTLYTPVSHPFVERLIEPVRREYLDHVFYWSVGDLERRLHSFKDYFNEGRVHHGIEGKRPSQRDDTEDDESKIVKLGEHQWEGHCNGMFNMPKAA